MLLPPLRGRGSQSQCPITVLPSVRGIGSAGSIPPLLLVSALLLCVSVAILLMQNVQQCMPLSCQLQVGKFLQVLLPGLKLEESLEFLYPN